MHGTLLTSQCMETSGDHMSTSFISKAPGSLLPSLNPGLTLYYFTRGMVNWKKAVSQWKGTVIYQTKNILFTVFLANDHLDIWLRLLSGLERKWEAKIPASGFIVLSIFLRQTMLWRSWESWEQSPRQGHPVAAPNKAPVCICSAWGVSRVLYHATFCAARGHGILLSPFEWDRTRSFPMCCEGMTPGKWFACLFALVGVG